jgi:Fe-coproporphyrin III synthase
VRKLRALSPRTPVRARSTLHRYNFTELPSLIDKAHAMGLDGISFLAADVTSDAFGRGGGGDAVGENAQGSGPRHLLLTADEVQAFARVVEETLASHASDFASGFVAESPAKLRRLPDYYRAQLGLGEFPALRCNAPWASAVIEADGTVRPCFFHRAVGNIRRSSLREIMATEMVTFRRSLHMSDDAICRRCVCSLQFGLRTVL